MAESRLRAGTVFTRIRGLIAGGAMKYEDRPLWYDVYEAFPPRLPPVANRPVVKKEIREILYPEDIIRAQFYKKFISPGVINLVSPTGQTPSQKVVDTFLELAKDPSIPREELFFATLDKLAAQGTSFQVLKEPPPPRLTDEPIKNVDAKPYYPAPNYPIRKA